MLTKISWKRTAAGVLHATTVLCTCSCRSRCRLRGASSRPVHRSGFPLWTVQQVPDFPPGCDSIGFPRPKTVDSSRDGWSARALRATPTRKAGLLSAPRRNESSLSINQLAMRVGWNVWRVCRNFYGTSWQHLSHQLEPVKVMRDGCRVCHSRQLATTVASTRFDRMPRSDGITLGNRPTEPFPRRREGLSFIIRVRV